jgi:cytochrome c
VTSARATPGWRTARAACAVLLVAGIATASSGSIAADPGYGQYLAAECASCHGSASTTAAIPPLGVVGYEGLVTALKAFRAGNRAEPTMQSVARSLGDAEIEALAAYFSNRS